MQIIIKNGQWLGDIVLRVSGSIEGLFDLALRNNLSVTDDLTVGNTLSPSAPIDRRVMNYYYTNDIEPSTAIAQENIFENEDGIGYMIINKTFIVR